MPSENKDSKNDEHEIKAVKGALFVIPTDADIELVRKLFKKIEPLEEKLEDPDGILSIQIENNAILLGNDLQAKKELLSRLANLILISPYPISRP